MPNGSLPFHRIARGSREPTRTFIVYTQQTRILGKTSKYIDVLKWVYIYIHSMLWINTTVVMIKNKRSLLMKHHTQGKLLSERFLERLLQIIFCSQSPSSFLMFVTLAGTLNQSQLIPRYAAVKGICQKCWPSSVLMSRLCSV